ncbi:hypothetical protein N7474_005079 [Penicillium riverlandense]|uniref:uncharacterized protein n=1 Tax=Penicillium riverlandense TaxID=1903569 RepID=UPI0025485D2D|nr:uncharacterized protein N7474_005079 [Penicillium riverlandense]KAJ5819488.1 hypothetical protein N7474_005079 [Penicillium riverlandense]
MADKSDDCTVDVLHNTPIDMLNISEPGQSETIEDLLERGKTQKVRILIGSENPQHKCQIPYARTKAWITFDKEEALRECVRLLRWSDERLRSLVAEGPKWAWEKTFREGMTISFGVNWYDRNFFEQRRDAFTEPKHAAYYRRFGADPEDFHITHLVQGDPGFDEEVMNNGLRWEFIGTLQIIDAPDVVAGLMDELSAVQVVLVALDTARKNSQLEKLTPDVRMMTPQSTITMCRIACDNFRVKLARWTKHSDDKIHLWDRVNVGLFAEWTVEALSELLSRYKSTICSVAPELIDFFYPTDGVWKPAGLENSSTQPNPSLYRRRNTVQLETNDDLIPAGKCT